MPADVRDTTRGLEGEALRRRWPYDAARRLCGEPEEAQADRRGVWVGEDDCGHRQGESAWARPRAPLLHAGDDRLQSDPHAKAAGMDHRVTRKDANRGDAA